MPAYKLCIRHTYTRNAKRIDKSAYLHIARFFYGVHHIVKGFFSKSFHGTDTLPIAFKVIYVGIRSNHTIIYELFKGCFGYSVNIEGIS